MYAITIIVTVISFWVTNISMRSPTFSSQPPDGLTGATGNYCTNCHSSFAINSGGGSVTTSGLPAATYTPGTEYNFSITIAHTVADRKKWGFSIIAINSAGTPVGTFSTTNPNAAINGSELSHFDAVLTGLQSSFTYTNLKWTAPSSGSGSNSTITFYYVGNAANSNMTTSGDYIYSGTKVVTASVVPVTFSNFTVGINDIIPVINWSTENELNTKYFVVEKSLDGFFFTEIGRLDASGNSNTSRNYSYNDRESPVLNTPVYYRIAAVDFDNTKNYTSIKSITLKWAGNYIKYIIPNPAKAGNLVEIMLVSERSCIADVRIVSYKGQILLNKKQAITKGANIFKLMIPAVNAGSVIIDVDLNGQKQRMALLLVN